MTVCTHCDEEVIRAVFGEDDLQKGHPFCCDGCLTVYNVIYQKGLESYYEIKQNSQLFKRRSPVEVATAKFHYMDEAQFLSEYSYRNLYGEKTMEFYLEGIHCLACLWLIEKLPDFVESVLSSKLDLERSVVTVALKPEGKFSIVAKEFSQLGYRPHVIKQNQDSVNLKIKENRSALLKIGVAGAATGNIMLYSVSLYAGASDSFATVFNLLTILFALPVLTYCAYPFYKNAWHALRNKTLSIDIPISIALIIGAIMGVVNLINGVHENYFDSLTALVFLLLMSRFFLQKIQEQGLSSQDLHYFYLSDSVLKAVEGSTSEFQEIHPKFIKAADILKIRAGEFIPADGFVLQGSSHLNTSLLTGESYPSEVVSGQKVFSGTQNLDQDLVIQVEKVQQETRLGHILRNVENGWAHRSKIVDFTSRVSKYFTLAVFFLSLVLFVYTYSQGDVGLALERAITLLIVTCPCALALATPLTFTRALSQASKHGIIIKSDAVIEKLANVKNIFLDKTGTLTHGKLQITELIPLKMSSHSIEDILLSLEHKSRHPVATALVDFAKAASAKVLPVTNHLEILGKGVSGNIDESFYEINRQGVFENGHKVAVFKIEDQIRKDSRLILQKILEHGTKIQILSGDRPEVVNQIASSIDLPPAMAHANLSPEEKSELIKNSSHSMMVGDGANDAIALSHADVGVAVFGAMDISLRAADVFLSIPGLAPVEKLLTLSEETMKVVRRNLVLSLFYNSLSVVAVFMGLINPLVAAIVMPLSSLTVLVSTVIGTKKLRVLWKS